jgi:ubiquinone/menaquinone biosynthesis C-methylase UbiE
MTAEASPNAANVQFWNDVLVAKFERFRSLFVGASDIHSRVPIERAGLVPGMRVLDVGCGFGETTLQIAELVGPGRVLGTDCCPPFLDTARADAARAGIANAEFAVADAQSCAFEPEFDLAFARFGTMFFESPVAGMRNIRSALVPGGRLLMVVWAPLESNPWLGFAKGVVQRHLPSPPERAPGSRPDPFSMADPDSVTQVLTSAGYTDVSFERTTATVRVGSSVEEALAFQLSIGPAAELLRQAPEEAERERDAIEADLRAVLEQHARPDGVWMETSSWAVSARTP